MPRLWAEAGNTVEMGECGGGWFFVNCRRRWLFWVLPGWILMRNGGGRMGLNTATG